MKVLGCDVSTFTGLCLLEQDAEGTVTSHTKLLNFPGETGFKRLHLLSQSFRNMLEEWKPDVISIEAYAYGNKHTLVTLVEVGTLLRKTIYDSKIPWYEVTPNTLKKYVTGKGTAKKTDMAASVLSRWGFSSKSDDVVDAYALARLILEVVNQPHSVPKGVNLYEYR